MALSPDGRSLAVMGDKALPAIFSLDKGDSLFLKTVPAGGKDLGFSPDGKRLLIGTGDNGLSIVEPRTGREILRLDNQKGMINSLAFSPDGRFFVTGGITGEMRRYRTAR